MHKKMYKKNMAANQRQRGSRKRALQKQEATTDGLKLIDIVAIDFGECNDT